MVRRRYWMIAALVVGLAVTLYFIWPRSYCRSALVDYNIEVPECPDGKVRQTLRILGQGLKRGGKGTLRLFGSARYTVALADEARVASIDASEPASFAIKLSILDGDGKERPLTPTKGPLEPREGWRRTRLSASATVALPADLRDGDYLLRARVKTKIDESTVDLPLGLYAPAKIHVLTDRPLYEPGHRIRFRALALRARDLTPIDHRPGTWIVKDPSGTVLLEEKAPAGEWGVVAGSFLLDAKAPVGQWTVSWHSGKDSANTTVRVEPFKLPRFRVQAAAAKPFYRAGERPKVSGSVVYSSGAPVQGAKVELEWTVGGAWPPPATWRGPKGLPRNATTDAAGAFSVTLPVVPSDLQGKVTLAARIAAVDPAGDRVAGATSLLLSEEPIAVSALTALSGGLIGGSNNRLYLRVTTADGQPLPGAKIKVRKAWQPDEPGVVAELDADSVARIQIDPGAPVTVVIPARPYRPQLARARAGGKVTRTGATDLLRDEDATLDDQVELDRWLALLVPCAKLVSDDQNEARIALKINEAGAIVSGASQDALGRCALERVRRRRLPRGKPRYYQLTFELSEPDLPKLTPEVVSALGEVPDGLTDAVEAAARDARDCLPRKGEGALPWVVAWRVAAKSDKLAASWLRSGAGAFEKMPAGLERCVLSALSRQRLAEPATTASEGVVRYAINQPEEAGEVRPQPTTMRGYELLVAATAAGAKQSLGQAKLRLPPGKIPPLTVRARPVLARPGAKIALELLRGPGFAGALPRRIMVEHLGDSKWIKLEKKDPRKASYTLPKGKSGWFSFFAAGQRALVFVRSPASLTVAVKPERPRYAPGATARLLLQTRAGQRPVKAGVGLFGVDRSLAQLAPLPGPGALDGLRPAVTMSGKAFGELDGQALALGRIRGAHAAEATVLKVTKVPTPAELDALVSGSAETRFDAVGELTDRFYTVLGELHRVVRAWEKQAPKSEQMRPKKMAELWQKALEATKAKGKRIDDAYGRRLRLHRLPPDLLALAGPRQVVIVGTRLPEDVESWRQWVGRNKP